MGATVTAEFHDAAITGTRMVGRPGLADLLASAKRGEFDVVIAEALDRLTRSGGDAWDLLDDLRAAGVEIHTISEGHVEELVTGLKGTMNALFVRELALKVRRGQAGVVRSGRSVSITAYGYRRKRIYDDAGEPIRGVLEIHDDEAVIVRRIADEFLAGSSGHSIALRLNQEGVKGPRDAGWDTSTIIGRPGALRGILRNPLYSGELVWNRQTRITDRRSGKSRLKNNPVTDLVRQPVPHLTIIDAATWSAVQARLTERSAAVAAAGNASAANQPKRLLSGLVRCGLCGSVMHSMGPGRRYRCLARARKGPAACDNGRSVVAEQVEIEALDALRRDLLHPEVIETVVREYHAARARKHASAGARRGTIERDLAEVERRASRLVDQVAEGVLEGRTVAAKLAELEARRVTLEAELATAKGGAEILALHPRTASRYRELVDELQRRLEVATGSTTATETAKDAARDALRQVIRSVLIFPEEGRGKWRVEIDGDLTSLLGLASAATDPNPRRAKA